jgi:hypothetical protein
MGEPTTVWVVMFEHEDPDVGERMQAVHRTEAGAEAAAEEVKKYPWVREAWVDECELDP